MQSTYDSQTKQHTKKKKQYYIVTEVEKGKKKIVWACNEDSTVRNSLLENVTVKNQRKAWPKCQVECII